MDLSLTLFLYKKWVEINIGLTSQLTSQKEEIPGTKFFKRTQKETVITYDATDFFF